MNKQAEVLFKYRWALLVLLVGITLSVLLGYKTQSNNMLRINQAMQGALDVVSEDILTKVKLYQYGLRGARGSVLTAGEHGISRALFYRYSLTRDVDLEFPGARGFGFIRRVSVSDTPQFLANARADGWPEFSIRELSPNSKERYVIQYIEPVERNKAAVGLDIASEHNRYAAATSAMLSGEVRLTGPITLVQASGLPAQSFLILMPLYRSVKTPETAAEREKQAFGWSYAPLTMAEVLAHVRLDANKFILSLDDVTEPETPVRFFNNAVDATGLYPFNAIHTIYGRSWRFNMAAQPAFIRSMHLQSPVKVGLFGAMASLLLALLAGLVETNRRNRERFFVQQTKELELRESKYLAEAANRAKSMFLANMSHEIRTPMNAVLGMLQLIKSTELSTQQHDYTSKAQIAAKSLLNLINDILDYSKIEAGKLELEQQPFNTESLLRELDVVLSPSLDKKNIELLFDVDSALPAAVEGDRLRLQQVLVNLTSNAIKFTTEGEVVLQLALLQLQDKKARVRFSVRDTGIGISPSQQQRIFEGFTQAEASTTRQYGGTGLGLVISKRIVELMGGELQLQSEPGKGSRFWFDLEFNVATEVETQRPVTIGSDTRVLIVDDNTTALEILQKTVEQLGARVMLARSGEEALACVEHCFATNQTLHVVLMDYRMPGMNGLEVAQCIKAKSDASNLPVVIMVSAFGRDEIMKAQTTEVLPYAAYLTKPVTPQQVGALIEGSISGDILKPSARVRPELSTSPLRGLRLLLVEDNEFNRVVASELLEHEGAVVDMAVGGQEGIDAIIKGNTSYDLVLMDVQMPVIDGLEATRQIRADKRFASLPIIAMTANVYTSDQEDCIKAGMNGHLAKPFDLDKVIETILFFTNKNLDKDTHLLLSDESTEQPVHSARLSGDAADSNGVDNERQKAPSETVNPAQPELQEIHFERKNLEVLLKPFGGKEAFFRRLIHVFEANFTSQLVSLQEKIKQNDHHEVLAILHAIKGTSGTIGLATSYQVICQLETQLKQYFNLEEFELSTLYSGLPERLDFIARHELSDIHQLLAKKEAKTSEAALPPAYDKDYLIQMLETLRPYLQTANMEVLTLSQQLKEKLVGHEQLLSMTKDLFDTIEQLNFEQAVLELNRLSK
ncbi:response regulator [Shewanella baltica]|uniref:CHASE domain-containing protein n=1 Tax=Shewanella baltica TaxID=62322 RepID=UPI00217D1099|nr:CHASE domain-containing protein [Shewanella baltica]MCS6128550.1 response regulator [Shewanella baltica]MCS6140468.1 response regulator [Shewanella baltica]MCS6146764.1 response regulator [Shewanella baltica]MCS6171294.1 response regulator [Shewanella baltica]MCS6188518.1 response regulator [Shewanella baltica]